MANSVLNSIADLARLRRIDLRPDWADSARGFVREDDGALDAVCEQIGWAPAFPYLDDARAHEFPLLVFHPEHGWGVAEQVEDDNRLKVMKNGLRTTWRDADKAKLYDLVIPLPAGRAEFAKAFDVFKAAVFRRKHVLVLAIIVTFVVNIIALATSLFTMQVYDRVVPRGAFSTLWVLAGGVFVALIFDFVLRVVRANMLEKEAVQIDTEVSEYFFSKAADVRLDARPPSIGTMAAQLRGLEQVRSVLSSSVVFALADLPFAILFIAVIAMLGGVIALVMAVAFPLAVCIALFFAYLIRDYTKRAHQSGNRKNGLLVEALDSAETVKANRGQWFLLSRWNSLLDEVHDAELPVKRLQAMAGSIFGTMQQMSYIVLVSWGAVEVFENRITMGALIACSIISGRVNGPLIAQLPGLLVQWSYARSSLNMLDSILALPSDKPADLEQLRPNRLAPSLSVRELQFAYPGGRSGVSIPKLEIKAGERIGILGPVGSGKSTLLKLMSGLYAPAEGQILIDQLDMSQVADDILRENIGYLPQDYRLVNGTLRDNLLLGVSDPGDDRIMEVAQQTGLAGMITNHPRGLDLEISEGGRGLSGGQRVLTGLTRLLLAKPRMMLLDEPTSNLDVDTENLVLRTIAGNITKEDTLIIVTHKLQIVNLVQRLILVAGGQVVMDGPTQEVLKRLQKPQAQPAGGQRPAIGANAQ
ncbi:MAG: ATP-binding cassette domain-containing protein [Novosphingobium sp.]|nr:ATP-binding cassette domain-containing protein [Novosphingobium sp.]